MSHRKWNNGPNELDWPVRPIWPVVPFPVLHSMSPGGTAIIYKGKKMAKTMANKMA